MPTADRRAPSSARIARTFAACAIFMRSSMPMRQAMRQTDSMRRTSSRLSYLSSSRIAPLYDRFLERQKEDQCEDEGYSDGKAAVCELAANIIVRHPISMRVDKKWSRETAEELLRNVHLTPYELGLLDWSDWRGDSQAVVELAAAATMLFSNDDIVPVNRIRKAFLRRASPSLGHPSAQGSLRRRCLCSSSGPRTTRTIFISRICR